MQVFCANLKERDSRKAHILHQYNDKPQFHLTIINAIKHEYGAIGLWQTFQKILKQCIAMENKEFFIFCEDDHLFTDDFNFSELAHNIAEAKRLNADLLLGGVSSFEVAFKCKKNIYWLDQFTGCQFMVVFRKFYDVILSETNFTKYDALDHKLSAITENIFVIFPFISVQKEFGYSDATNLNNIKGRVDSYFEHSSKKLQVLSKINSYLKR